MMTRPALFLCLALAALYAGTASADNADNARAAESAELAEPAESTDSADLRAIRTVLATYTRSVSEADRPAFEALLLDPSIPFHGLADGRFAAPIDAGLAAVQNYAGFRKSVFESGRKLQQRFFDVKIAHQGDLAQVSLNFETLVVATGGGARGWKTLDLLRVGGRWKIASEFYTVYAIDAGSQAARDPGR